MRAIVSAQIAPRGFTLIELAGHPGDHRHTRRHRDLHKRLAGAPPPGQRDRALHQRLEALQLAVATRQPWRLCALGANGQCGKNWNRGYQWTQADGGGGRLAGEHPLTGVGLVWNGGNQLTFNSTPWHFNTSLGSFWVCTASDGNKLTLNDAGRVTLTQGDRSGCPP
ncbi:hypothetical protein [Salinicola tamaricis]|uniref:hypothetical protein n=1 Tax=Salinicola tamaricis TaxID=1771309 RepID=UPI000D0A4F21|nr:hypothetical protein [Salinicola tamaricis]